MVVLAFLAEEPTHAYRLHELIKTRGKDSVVNVAQRNSVYQTLARLLRDGLIRVRKTARGERSPDRVIHEVTALGNRTLHQWLENALAETPQEFPQVVAALSLIMLLPPKTAHARLQLRRDALSSRLEASRAVTQGALDAGVPRLFLLEDDYREAMLRAEMAWLDRVLVDLESGALVWSKAWLEEQSRRMHAQASTPTNVAARAR